MMKNMMESSAVINLLTLKAYGEKIELESV